MWNGDEKKRFILSRRHFFVPSPYTTVFPVKKCNVCNFFSVFSWSEIQVKLNCAFKFCFPLTPRACNVIFGTTEAQYVGNLIKNMFYSRDRS